VPQLRRAVVAAALGALLLITTAPLAVAHDSDRNSIRRHREVGSLRLSYGYNADPLRDLQLSTDEPFDGAYASVTMISWGRASYFALRVRGVDQGPVGQRYGAHLHTESCVAGDGDAAGPHYNIDLLAGVPKAEAEVSSNTEVWLDFKLNSRGEGRSSTVVPFVPADGERAIVIHADPTDTSTGGAGARLACLPLTID
jgi:Cu/Zn superoxide dismutase